MIPARECVPKVLSELLRGQPMSEAKISFAWRASVGEVMARSTSVQLDPTGTLRVRANTDHWRRETARSAVIIKRRLVELLGNGIVKRVIVRGSF